MAERGARVETQTLYQRIQADIEAKIVSGDWPPGHRLPTELEMCAIYGCSRMTVNKVLTQLTRDGLIDRRKRAGSFVLQPRSQAAIIDVHDVRTEVEALNRPYGYRLLQQSVRPAREQEVVWLGEEMASDRLLILEAVHLASGRPFCAEWRAIDLDTVPSAERADFATTPPSTWLLHEVPWTVAEHTISAIGATGTIATALELPERTPCLQMERRTWNLARPVTVARLTYPGDANVFVARFTPVQDV
ncbi:MAG: histidine utilization repressor [Thermomicrobiales bacterium]|nr:histidine utilization repressor [Thermomicrobiales bacterium]